VLRGPVSLDDREVPIEAFSALGRWASWHGFAFLRFSHSSAAALDGVATLPGASRENPFPFYSDLGYRFHFSRTLSSKARNSESTIVLVSARMASRSSSDAIGGVGSMRGFTRRA
jgi:hypothetical protein